MLTWTDAVLALAWMAGAVLLVLFVHAMTRRLLPPPADAVVGADGHDYPPATRDAATAIGLRLATLYGVLLALVYAQQLGGYQAVRDGVAREAGALGDLYHDAARYGGPAVPVIQGAVREYAVFVIDREWALLGTERRLSQRAWGARERAYQAVLDLDPTTPRERALRERMLRRISDIADYRRMRQELAAGGFGGVFWVPALLGLVLVASSFFVFPPRRELRWMLGGFGAFAGLILFFIQAFASPFDAPLRESPGALERLIEAEIGRAPPP
jgi:hypothetical protein